MDTFGERLRSAIHIAGLTPAAFARRIDMDLPQLSKFLNGRRLPRFETLELIVWALPSSVDTNWLILGYQKDEAFLALRPRA